MWNAITYGHGPRGIVDSADNRVGSTHKEVKEFNKGS